MTAPPMVFTPLADHCLRTLAASHGYDFAGVALHLQAFGLWYTPEQCQSRYMRLAAFTAQSAYQTPSQPLQPTGLEGVTDTHHQLSLAAERDGHQTSRLNLPGSQDAQQQQQSTHPDTGSFESAHSIHVNRQLTSQQYPEDKLGKVKTSDFQHGIQTPREQQPNLGNLGPSHLQDVSQLVQPRFAAQSPAQNSAQYQSFPVTARGFQPHPNGTLIDSQPGVYVEQVLGQQEDSQIQDVWDLGDAQTAQSAQPAWNIPDLGLDFGGFGDLTFEPSFWDPQMNTNDLAEGFAAPQQDLLTFPNAVPASTQDLSQGQSQVATRHRQPQVQSTPAVKPGGRTRAAKTTNRNRNVAKSSSVQKSSRTRTSKKKFTAANLPKGSGNAVEKGVFYFDAADDQLLRQAVAAVNMVDMGNAKQWDKVAQVFAKQNRPWSSFQLAHRWEKILFADQNLSLARRPIRSMNCWTVQEDLLVFQGLVAGKSHAQLAKEIGKKSLDSVKKRVSNLVAGRIGVPFKEIVDLLKALLAAGEHEEITGVTEEVAGVNEP